MIEKKNFNIFFFFKSAGNNAANLRKIATDKDWSVEAAQVLVDWASKEEYHKFITCDFGVQSLLDLLAMEPSNLIEPLMGVVISKLIEKDATKQQILELGGIHALSCFNTLNCSLPLASRYPTISQFVSRSIALIANLVSGTFLLPMVVPCLLQFRFASIFASSNAQCSGERLPFLFRFRILSF